MRRAIRWVTVFGILLIALATLGYAVSVTPAPDQGTVMGVGTAILIPLSLGALFVAASDI